MPAPIAQEKSVVALVTFMASMFSFARHNLRVLLSRRIEELTRHPAPTQQNTAITDGARRPDLAFQNWRGETRWVDVAAVSPFARACGDPKRLRAGAAASDMEGVK